MSIADAILWGSGILGAAVYFGLARVEDAIDNVAVGIEQLSLNICSLLQDEEAE
jgi:hypothetical protein